MTLPTFISVADRIMLSALELSDNQEIMNLFEG
jgi:hypothetical protein